MLNEIDEGETALIWSPEYGFRLLSPEHDHIHKLSLPETFLTVIAMQINEEFMMRMTGEYLSHFKKH